MKRHKLRIGDTYSTLVNGRGVNVVLLKLHANIAVVQNTKSGYIMTRALRDIAHRLREKGAKMDG